MKKFIKSLVLTLVIIPCILFMSACDGSIPQQNPEYDLTIQSIYELVQAKGYEGTFDEFLTAIKGDNGTDGEDGRGIVDIRLTNSNNGIDTYTITYSDSTYSTFTITNGRDGQDGADGKDGQDGQQGVDGRGIVSITCLTYFIEIPGMQHPDYYTYRILYSDGSHFDYKVYNGKNGTDGKDGTSITSITQTNNDANNSSTITITDSTGETKEFTLYNGVDGKDATGIDTITKTSTDGLVDTYTITFTNDKAPFTYTVTNGKDGTDGIGIEDLAINTDGELEIRLTNSDTPINLGKVKGEDGKDGSTITEITKTNTSGLLDTYTISCSDGEKFTFTVTNGKDGADGEDGRGIKTIKQTETTEADGRIKTTIVFEYTDGIFSDPIYIFSGKDGANGSTGKDGVGITNISSVESQDGTSTTITITYGNNDLTEKFTIYNGNDGEDGADGADGRGIVAISKTSTSGLVDTYTITYTDNTTSTFTVTNGKDGADGEDGADGKDGISVVDASINASGELIITLSDEKTINVGNVKGETGNGIESIEKTKTDGLKDTYTITYTNGDTTTFTVVNGRGIKEIKKESNGLIDTYTITYTDGSEPYVFTVTNGQNGLSAYEIYKIHNPSYTKGEDEWIIDLTNGDLSTNRLTVSFDSNGGTEVETQTNIKFGGKASKPANPIREGYVFDGWYYENEKWSFIGYSVTEDITLIAKWIAESYTISFDTKGYGNFEDIVLTFEDDLILPNIDIAGYTYEWKIDGVIIDNGKWNIASDVTIELVLTSIEYTITYILDGGINGLNNPDIYTIESETIVLEDATKENYYFAGWYDNDQFGGEKITSIENGSTGNKVLYAYFKNSVTASISANGGNFDIEEKQFIIGEKFYLPEPIAPDGYVFNGWVANPLYTDKGVMYSYRPLDADTLIFPEMREIVATWSAVFEVENGKITGLTSVGESQSVIKIPSQIDGVEITTLGEYCLYHNNTNITEIHIPETITKIEFRAIYKVENLIKLYYNAKNLNNLTYLDNANFTQCGTLSGGYEVIIGKDVETIPAYFMYNNENVYQRTNKVNVITFEETSKCLSIGDYAFAYTAIKNITLPDTLTNYGKNVFTCCEYLEEVNNFKNIVKINEATFAGCTSLKSIELSDNITAIEKSAFSGCSSLQSIKIPSSLNIIEESVFASCCSLSEIM